MSDTIYYRYICIISSFNVNYTPNVKRGWKCTLAWIGNDQSMKMSESSRGKDKKPYVNNNAKSAMAKSMAKKLDAYYVNVDVNLLKEGKR